MDFVFTFVVGLIFVAGMFVIWIVMVRSRTNADRTGANTFSQVMQNAAVRAVPETADFEKVAAVGVKEPSCSLNGYERVQSGYDTLPDYIVCYKEDELYIMAAPIASRRSIEVDTENILHLTRNQIEDIKIEADGQVVLFLKYSTRFFAMAVGKLCIAPQIEQYENFMNFIQTLTAEETVQ